MLDLSIRSVSLAELNRQLGKIADALRDTPHVNVITVTSPTTASLPFTVPHTLGVIPTFAVGVDDTGNTTAFADSDKRMWTTRDITIRSATATTKYTLFIAAVK